MSKLLFIILVMAILCCGCDRNTRSLPKVSDNPTNPSKANSTSNTAITSESDIKTNSNITLMNQIVNSTGTLSSEQSLLFGEDNYYILYSTNEYGYRNTFSIINSNCEIIRTFHDVIVNNVVVGQIPKDSPLIIGLSTYKKMDVDNGHSDNYSYGLYLPSSDSFLVKPEYDTVIQYTSNIYGCFKNGEISFIDQEGNLLFIKTHLEDYYVQLIGDNFWFIPTAKGIGNSNYYIYDQAFNLKKVISGYTGYGYTYGDGYVYWEPAGIGNEYSIEVLDPSGNIVISTEILVQLGILPATSNNKITSINYYKDAELFLIHYGDYQFILNMEYKILDVINTFETTAYYAIENRSYYKYIEGVEDSDRIIYDNKGNPIQDKLGNYYNFSLNDHSAYRFDNNNIFVYNYLSKIEYKYPITKFAPPYVISLSEDLYMITIQDSNSSNQIFIYYKDSLIFDKKDYALSYRNYGHNGDYQILYSIGEFYDAPTINTIINRKGEIVYTSPYDEKILCVDDDYIQVVRGNYIGIVDYNGNYVFKMLDPMFGND